MFLHNSVIVKALNALSASADTFYGVTFLACKLEKLPVGSKKEFAIDKAETELLNKYYRPDPNTERYYRVFRTSDKQNQWLRPDFPSKGSQRTRTSKFQNAFLHRKGTNLWGWANNYVDVLEEKLYRKQRIPALSLAIWLYRERDWKPRTTAQKIVETFYSDFNISTEEQTRLFDNHSVDIQAGELVFQTAAATWQDIRGLLDVPPPPDAPRETGATLSFLSLRDVGPSKLLELNLAERINLFTGDNGLGKTFILECAWWALCGRWTNYPAYPRSLSSELRPNEVTPRISFQIAGSSMKDSIEATFNWKEQEWVIQQKQAAKERLALPGLLIYACVDGAFAVWDPARLAPSGSVNDVPPPIFFSKSEVWDGLPETVGGKIRYVANGLINDWILWQTNPDSKQFETLKRVLRRLSPSLSLAEGDLGVLEPGKPSRIAGESRLIPTIKHSYGEVPLIFASAGVQRIVALAYLIVWVWEEHKNNALQTGARPENKLVMLIDEIEAHLHPKWQRVILPSLLDVADDLERDEADLEIQFLIATHSPLVTVSVEPQFDSQKDKIFHLDVRQSTLFEGEVYVKEVEFERRGTVNSWLTHDEVFEFKEPRNVEAEKAVLDAVHLQEQDAVTQQDVQELTDRLVHLLGNHDSFWPRWIFFARKHGVEI